MKLNKNIILFTILILQLFISSISYAKLDLSNLNGNRHKHPTADEAFKIDAFIKNNNEIQLLFSAIDNTYIYQQSFSFNTDNKNISLYTPQYPEAKTITDEHYGLTKVFSGNFQVSIPYQSDKEQDFEFILEYQGCLKDVLCYPPKTKKFFLTALASTGDSLPTAQPITTPKPVQAIKEQQEAFNLLKNASVFYIIGGFFLFGLLLSLTPCVLPMLPILSGIIAGHKHDTSKTHAFILSLVYVLSMAFTYMAAGVLVASLGVDLSSSLQHPAVIISISLLFIFLAIASFGYVELKLPNFVTQKLAQAQQNQKGGTYMGVAIMGVLSALVISPCATAPLSGALIYISSTGNAWLGGIALFSMGFAMGVPLLLFGTTAGHWLPKAGPWMNQINVFFGVVFIGMAIFLLSRIIPGPLTLVLSALLLIFYSVYLGLLEPANHGWQRIQKAFALVMTIYGAFLLAGATQNQSDIFHPFGVVNNNTLPASISSTQTSSQNKEFIQFEKIKTISDLNQSIESAKQNKKFTMVEFYADWCTYCKDIEKNVFTDPKVQSILKNFNNLKVDLTHKSSEDEVIKKELSVFAPPTIIFYDQNGEEIKDLRIVGNISSEDFYSVLKSLG